MNPSPAIEPDYSPAQREELLCIDYLLGELRALQDRGVVTPESVSLVEAEKSSRRAEVERLGWTAGILRAAHALMGSRPREALALADEARAFAPERIDTWTLSAEISGMLGEYGRAIALGREAVDVHGHVALEAKIASYAAQAERRARAAALADGVARARAAISQGGHFETALAAAREVLGYAPLHAEALAISIRSLSALGRLDEAEAALAALRQVRPGEAADWATRIRAQRPQEATEARPASVEVLPGESDFAADAPRPGKPSVLPLPAWTPTPRWSEIAGEFLEDHWQKLILSLAVLLIVVSSTVGAAVILGDRLWMAEGKCLLATAYTLMFAGFGHWLSRWGAERAGRIMRLTTLIVLPLDFALVGELPGLGRASWSGMAVLAIDSGAMMALAWMVCRALGLSGGRGTPAVLIALGMVNALTPRSIAFPLGFAAMLVASGVFAASGEWLGSLLARSRRPEGVDEDDAPYFAFGLMAFYYLCVVARIGGYVLGLPPTLYALPAMLAAAAAVRVADGLKESGRVERSVALLRLAGYATSALAFALALARPMSHLPLFSGNTLATALVGLALYGRSLWKERKPAYLYAAFAAFCLVYFGSKEFFKDLFSAFEGSIGGALGYGRKLPLPFRGLNGLVLNVLIAGMSIVFSRRWKDDRLAKHCQYIGLPVSIAACVLSCLDPLAAVLTMGGYTIAFGLATWLFARPALAYLASLSFAGAAVAGSTYLGDLALGARSLALATVGLVLWIACRVLAMERIPPAYRVPVVRSARAISAVALLFAAWAALPIYPPTWSTAWALWALTGLYVLIALEAPLFSVAYAAVSCAAVASILTIRLVTSRFGWPIGPIWLAAWSSGLSLIDLAASPWLGRVVAAREERSGRPSRARPYPVPLVHLGLILAALATWLVTADVADHVASLSTVDLAGIAATMGLIAIGLALTSAWSHREGWLEQAAVLAGTSGAVAMALTASSWRGGTPSPMRLGLACAGGGLILAVLGDRIRGRETGWLALYRRPMIVAMSLAVAIAWFSGASSPRETWPLTVTLTLTALALALAVRQAPVRPLPDLALASGMMAWMVGWGLLDASGLEAIPRFGVLILVYLASAFATVEVFRLIGKGGEFSAIRRVLGACLPEFAGITALTAVGMGAVAIANEDFRVLTAVLALGSLVFLWLPRFRREAGLIHLGLVLAWFASCSGTLWVLGPRIPEDVLGWLALTTALDGLLVCGLRSEGRRRGLDEYVLDPLRQLGNVLAGAAFFLSLIVSSLVPDAYPLAVTALLLLIPALAVSAAIDRSSWRVYAAVVAGVAAAYVTLFELGRGRQGHASALGVLASLLAIACWGIERAVSLWARERWRDLYAAPLGNATIALALFAVVPEWDSPRALLLASVPFLLLIQSRPSVGWLYPALGLMVASSAFAIVHRRGPDALMPASVTGGFVLWVLGLTIWRWKPALCRRLRLAEGLGFEFPAHHAAMALGVTSLGFWIDTVVHGQGSWWSGAWVPASVAVLSLLMIKAYPGRGWVDGFAGLMSLAVMAACGANLTNPLAWALAVLTLALLWRMAQWVISPLEEGARDRLGIGFGGVADVLGLWSLGLLAAGMLPLVMRIGGLVLFTTLGVHDASPSMTSIEWWEGLPAILLFGANLDLTRRTYRFDPDGLGPHLTGLLLTWWLVLHASPVVGNLSLDPATVPPLATGVLAAVAAWMGVSSRAWMVAFYGLGLSLVAVVLTGGKAGPATTATLFLVSAVQGGLAVSVGVKTLAGIGSALWMLALLYASRDVAGHLGWALLPTLATPLAVGQLLGAIGLVAAGGRARRRHVELARVVEGFAILGLSFAALAVGWATLNTRMHVGPTQALVHVGVMFAVGSLCVVLASRWSSIPLAFAAQVSLLLGYAAFRSGFALPPSADSTAMLILAGIDLGIAEVAGRGRRRLFALPAFATGLALPLISVGLALRHGVLGEETLFVLFAAGTFFAATGARMQRKALGFASAVLYNASLWVLWSRFGWRLAADPQLFLVPVGFTTILFAEANRRELGRNSVNAIRGVGLSLIYLSLAVPIWQTASLLAWATILGASLLGIFAGIGLRSQAFLWLGLAGFVLDVVYQLGRIGMEHALAKWAIMLALGLGLFFFVALNEKKKLVETLRKYVEAARQWE